MNWRELEAEWPIEVAITCWRAGRPLASAVTYCNPRRSRNFASRSGFRFGFRLGIRVYTLQHQLTTSEITVERAYRSLARRVSLSHSAGRFDIMKKICLDGSRMPLPLHISRDATALVEKHLAQRRCHADDALFVLPLIAAASQKNISWSSLHPSSNNALCIVFSIASGPHIKTRVSSFLV